MKKSYLGLMAVVLAIALQAFPKQEQKTFGCSELLYWFQVSNLVACEQVLDGDIFIAPIPDYNNNNLPDELNNQYLRYASQNPFGCSGGEYACAVGFRANQLREDPFTHYWTPISANEYMCCVKKNLQ